MMPYCDIEGCEEVSERIFATEEQFVHVALCRKHNPESTRSVRRQKIPSDSKYTKHQPTRREIRARRK